MGKPTLDASASAASGGGYHNSVSVNLTIASDANFALVAFTGSQSGGSSFTASIDGVDMGSPYATELTNGNITTRVWRLNNPSTGTKTATVAGSGPTQLSGTISASSWKSVDTSDANGTSVTANGSSTTPSATINIGSNSLGYSAVACNWSVSTLTAGQSLLSKDKAYGVYGGGTQYSTATSSTAMSWTQEDTLWSTVAMTINGIASPSNTVAPSVTGTAQVGQTLTTTNGTWTGSPTGYAYQWQRADDSGFTTNVTNIGSDQNTFVLTASESGKYVRCVVTATNAGGSTAANSNVVGDVLPAAPTNSVAPSCSPSSGTTADNFVFSSGTWTGSPTSWSWEYRAQGSGGAWTQFSTSQNPTVAGSTFGAGTWDTLLTATNAGGPSTPANGTQITVTVPVTAKPSALLMAGVGP